MSSCPHRSPHEPCVVNPDVPGDRACTSSGEAADISCIEARAEAVPTRDVPPRAFLGEDPAVACAREPVENPAAVRLRVSAGTQHLAWRIAVPQSRPGLQLLDPFVLVVPVVEGEPRT